eukprot:TRINITY_DN11112_c0_g1_i1.p1 TRINITY_DN11112_c0_g1~~TRINITY_DN11112_c0_g1_i1.p1  ORF type:complete len:616 (-),score=98.15 TRINITY_DN11112_c0_g1_i1:34-1743(-)
MSIFLESYEPIDEGSDLPYSKNEWQACLRILYSIGQNPRSFPEKSIATLALAIKSFLVGIDEQEVEFEQFLLLRRGLKKVKTRKKERLAYKKFRDKSLLDSTLLRQAFLQQLAHMKKALPTLEGSQYPPLLTYSSPDDESYAKKVTVSTDTTDGENLLDSHFLPKEVQYRRICQICHKEYHRIHFFYGNHFCPECAVFNFAKRNQKADLSGYWCVVTGARIKIGYEIVLKLLRCGATVYGTTRFPVDAAKRFARESDFETWRGRLHLIRLDFKEFGRVLAFVGFIRKTFPKLDILVNNAAQTIQKGREFYSEIATAEKNLTTLPPATQALLSENRKFASWRTATSRNPAAREEEQTEASDDDAEMSQTSTSAFGSLDIIEAKVKGDDDNFVDTRDKNSWCLNLHEIPLHEFLEVQLINNITPFVMTSKLLSFLAPYPLNMDPEANSAEREAARTKENLAYIINVSAMEGQFYRHKSPDHAHTNMAKASLNMMTRTAAVHYVQFGVLINSVDTGWVTDEKPLPSKAKADWTPPLDALDGAARVLDPILRDVSEGEQTFGFFWKNYKKTFW